MECDGVLGQLKSFLHGELSAGEMRGVQVHLRGCLECRRALGEARAHSDVVAPLYFVAMAHGEVSDTERRTLEAHLAYCETCRDERDRLQTVSNELIKNLSQYELTRTFRNRVMQEWKPHRIGRRTRYNQRGLADMIERAEAGNTFSYERHVDRFKDYAYLAAFLAVQDFQWAGEIARRIFVDGMPVFKGDLSQADFLHWLEKRTREIGGEGGWLDDADELGETGEGLSGYAGSRKLRRHRLVISLHECLPEEDRMAFLLYYVQRLGYAEIASLLQCSRQQVFDVIDRSTRRAMEALAEDDRQHPYRRHIWEN